jgi:hypothetical protein
MKTVYLILCVLGFLVPYLFFIPFLLENGLAVSLMMELMFVNRISTFFAADVIVTSLVLWVFIYFETRKRQVKLWWLSVLANLAVGVSLALPLFLLLRQVAVDRELEVT